MLIDRFHRKRRTSASRRCPAPGVLLAGIHGSTGGVPALGRFMKRPLTEHACFSIDSQPSCMQSIQMIAA